MKICCHPSDIDFRRGHTIDFTDDWRRGTANTSRDVYRFWTPIHRVSDIRGVVAKRGVTTWRWIVSQGRSAIVGWRISSVRKPAVRAAPGAPDRNRNSDIPCPRPGRSKRDEHTSNKSHGRAAELWSHCLKLTICYPPAQVRHPVTVWGNHKWHVAEGYGLVLSLPSGSRMKTSICWPVYIGGLAGGTSS